MACQTTGTKTTTELHSRKRTAGTQKWISCKGDSFSNAGQTGYHFSGPNCSVLSFLWGVTIDQFRVIQATMAFRDPLLPLSAPHFGSQGSGFTLEALNGALEPGQINWFERGIIWTKPSCLRSMLIFRGAIYNMNVLLRCLVIPPEVDNPNAKRLSKKWKKHTKHQSINTRIHWSQVAQNKMYIYIYY